MRAISRIGVAAGATLLSLTGALGSSAPKPEPRADTVREEARVVVVEVPVNVVDKDGHPVENLKAEDFEVTDDGKPQTITGFEVLDQRRANVAPEQVRAWGLDPGRYALNVKLEDRKAGRSAESSFPFDVQ